MKYLIPIFILLSSCGIKDKIFNYNNSGSLGVVRQSSEIAKQPTETTLSDENVTSAENLTRNVKVIETRHENVPEKLDDETSWWIYSVPFIVIAIIAFLVFRLKKQNMNSL